MLDRSTIRSPRIRLNCNQVDNSVPTLLQLETRSLCHIATHACISTNVDKNKGLYQYSLESHWQSYSSDTEIAGQNSPCGSSMERTTLVPSTSQNADRLPPADADWHIPDI